MEIIYQDEMFTVTKPSMEYFESKINNYPKNLKKVNVFGSGLYHSTIEEFYAYRDKFNIILNLFKSETDEAFHIACLYHKQIDSSTCSIDIRYKYSAEEIASMLLSSYKANKDIAIKQIEEFISKNSELNWKREEERDNLIYKYNLLEEYKDKMQYNWKIAQDRLEISIDKTLEYFKKHNNDNNRV